VPAVFYKDLVRSASYLFSGGVASAAVSLFTMVLLARTLGLSEFGVFTLSQTYVLVFVAVVNFQIWQPVVKFVTPYYASGDVEAVERVVSKGIWVDLFVAVIFCCAGWGLCFAFLDGGYFSDQSLQLVSVFLILCLVNVSGSFNGLLRVFGEYRLLARDQLYFSLVRLICVVVASYLNCKLIDYVYVWVLSEAFFHFLIVRSCLKKFREKYKRGFRVRAFMMKDTPGFWSFTLSNNFDVSFRMVSKYVDVVLLGFLAGKEQVAIYKVAVQIASLLQRFTDPFYQVLLPMFSKVLAADGGQALRRLVAQISIAGIPVFLLMFFIFSVLADDLILLLFGQEYEAAFDVSLIYFLALSVCVVGLPYVPYFQAKGRADICMKVQMASTVVYLLSVFPLVDMLGMVGAALSYGVYYLAWMVIVLVVYLRFND